MKRKKNYGQTAKSRSIQIDIVISYNIIVCNRIRVPCPAGGRTSKKKKLTLIVALENVYTCIVNDLIKISVYFDHLQCFRFRFFFFFGVPLNKNIHFKRIGIEVLLG